MTHGYYVIVLTGLANLYQNFRLSFRNEKCLVTKYLRFTYILPKIIIWYNYPNENKQLL